MSDNYKYTAIVADDSEDIRRLVKRALECEGVMCDTVPDGLAAKERMDAQAYDIVISDLRMPRMHGHKLLVDMLESGSAVPFVVITGVTDPRVIRDLYTRGAADVLVKPFNFTVMALRMRHLLDQRRLATTGASHENISRQLESTTAVLQRQLSEVATSFESTIADLSRQREELESGYLGSVRVLANLMEQVGQSSRSHTVRVEKTAAAIAQRVDYPASELLNLKLAALLHEIGAFGMPDGIRLKPPWELDPEERKHFERYPEIGATVLYELKNGAAMVELVEDHAENFNGTGFPAKKLGRNVSLGARILRIADGCDTFLMHIHEADKMDALEAYLLQESGKKFDPVLVPHASDYFDELLRGDDMTFELPANQLYEGLTLAENIFDARGRFLAREGAELTATLVQRIGTLLRAKLVRVSASPAS